MHGIQEKLQTALAFHQTGQLQQALNLYCDILATHPDHPDTLNYAGVLVFQTGQVENAEALIGRALAQSPAHPQYCSNYGLVLEQRGRPQEARQLYQTALASDPTCLDAALNLSSLLSDLQRYAEALGILKAIRHHHPACAEIWTRMGVISKHARTTRPPGPEKHRKTQAYLEAALLRNPHHVRARWELAQIHAEQAHWQQAAEAYQTLLAQDPNHVDSLRELGHALIRLGELPEALQTLKKAQSITPNCDRTLSCLYHAASLLKELQSPPAPKATLDPPPSDAWDIVIFSPCTIQAFGGGQHPVQIAQSLQTLGHRVLFVEISMPHDNPAPFSIVSDLFMFQDGLPTPFQKERLHRVISQFTQAPAGQRVVLFDIFSPYLAGMVDTAQSLGYQTAYWCLDDWEAMGWPRVQPQAERQLMQQVDVLCATATVLANKVRNTTGRDCPVIPNGFSRTHFPLQATPGPCPPDLRKGEEKTLVYWGNLTGHWVNWPFLEAVARRNPRWTFNMIGEIPEDVPPPVTLPNVVFLGTRPVGELRHYGAHADAGIIHFHTSDVVAAVNPVKAYEYLACGLPIISTPMCELDAFPNTWQVHTPEEFEAAMAQIPQQPADSQAIETFLNQATWPERTRAFLAHVQATCLNNPTRGV